MKKLTFTLAELAEKTGSQLVGDPMHQVSNISDLESACAEDVSFLANPRYERTMHTSTAGAIFVSPAVKLPENRNFLITEDPSRAFQYVVELFRGDIKKETSGFYGIHPTAVIHETARIGEGVAIGPHAVIDQYVTIGHHSTISAGSYIGHHVTVGKECHIHPNVTIREYCTLGNRVVIQPGAVIGSCGFGYTTDQQGRHSKLEQLGVVIIEDDVEIGANTTIDRSRFKETIIREGTKIDNLVQIAHGVIIGQHNIIVAQTGIAGSAETGKYVILAGQVAVAGHIFITDKTMVAAKSGVSKSITTAGKYGGMPVMPLQEYNRNAVYLRNIEEYVKRLKALEKQIENL